MSPTRVFAREAPGTRIHLIKRSAGNPARKPSDVALFKDGYWEIHMSSSGEHPDFLKGWWKILLVTPAKSHIAFEIDNQTGLGFVPVSPGVHPVSLKTFINYVESDGVWWHFPAFIITLSDESEVRIQCGEAQPVSSHAIN